MSTATRRLQRGDRWLVADVGFSSQHERKILIGASSQDTICDSSCVFAVEAFVHQVLGTPADAALHRQCRNRVDSNSDGMSFSSSSYAADDEKGLSEDADIVAISLTI